METKWTITNCSQEEKRQIDEVWQIERRRLQGKLEEHAKAVQALVIEIEHERESNKWSVLLTVEFELDSISATCRDDDFSQAMQSAISDLIEDLELPRSSANAPQRQGQLEKLRNKLDELHASDNKQEFLLKMSQIVEGIRGYLLREMHVTAVNDDIDVAPADADDLLSQMTLDAWERYDEMHSAPTLNSWLMDRVHDYVDSLAEIRHREGDSLEERQPITNVGSDFTEDSDKEYDLPTQYETIALGEIIQGLPGIEQWDSLDIEDRQHGLAVLLSTLPRPNRQVFLLTAADGYEPAEVADLLGKSLGVVTEDLEDANRILRTELGSLDWAEIQESIERHRRRFASHRSERGK